MPLISKPSMTPAEIAAWEQRIKQPQLPSLGHVAWVLQESGLRATEIGMLLWPEAERKHLTTYAHNAVIGHTAAICFHCKRRKEEEKR